MGERFHKYAVEWLRIAELSPHPKVQRAFDAAWAVSIQEGFDPDKFRELYVVRAPGNSRYWVFDGQHRLAAARAALGEDQKIPCRVWDSIPIERQAELFLDINKSKVVKAFDKWTVRLLAKHEVPTKIEALLHRLNLTVSKTRGDGVIQAVVALESIWKREGGEAVLESVLTTIKSAWGRDPDAYDGLILKGLAGVMHHFGSDVDEKDLATKLARKGAPGSLIGRARSMSQAMAKGPSRCMTELIVNIYNERRRGPGKLEL